MLLQNDICKVLVHKESRNQESENLIFANRVKRLILDVQNRDYGMIYLYQ